MAATLGDRQSTSPDAATGAQASAHGLRYWLPVIVLLSYSLLNFLIISPAGNFPLNDDWIYSESVSHLMKTGQFHLLGCSPACILHVALGALACSLPGFSHEVLRGMIVVFGLATTFVLYATLLKFGLKRGEAALSAMILAANPIFVNVSYSFMTDVPAMLFAALYFYFTVTALQTRSAWRFVVAGMLLTCAILVRQTFVAFTACNALILLMFVFAPNSVGALPCCAPEHVTEPSDTKTRGRSMAAPLRHLWTPIVVAGVILPIAVAAGAENLMVRGNEFLGVYAYYKNQFVEVIRQIVGSPAVGIGSVGERLFKVFCYLGLFTLPVLPAAVKQLWNDLMLRRRSALIALAIAAAVAVPSFIHMVLINHQLMPVSQNLMRFPMVGALNLMGICVAGMAPRYRFRLTILCAILALLLMSLVVMVILKVGSYAFQRLLKPESEQPGDGSSWLPDLFSCALLVTTLAFLSIQIAVFDFDRYYITALPPLLLCLGIYSRQSGFKPIWLISIPLLILLAGYSTLATQDYLAWNRARWQAIGQLERAGVSPTRIDGGPEYNYLVNPALIKECTFSNGFSITHRGEAPRSDWRWWSVNGEDYIISFSPVPNYDVVARTKFWGGLTGSYREVLTLKRAGGQPAP